MPNSATSLWAFVAAAVVAAALTQAHLWIGRRPGGLGSFHPGPSGSVPVSGGIGIWTAFLLITLVAPGVGAVNWLIVGPTLAMFAIGLSDDIKPLTPQYKLLLQIAVSTAAVALGLRLDMPGLEVLGIPLSILWLVGMANAFNLIDNMDGLAAGVAALSGIFLSLHALDQGSPGVAIMVAVFAGAYAGFLPFNFKPARIFMGDSGSMSAGFFLAAVAVAGTWQEVSNLLFVIVIPLLILAVPMFNMMFIIVSRRLSGVPISSGRGDHINYRLVAHGLSERKSVLAIYALSAGCGALALVYSRMGNLALMAVLGTVTLAFLYFGVFLYEAGVQRFYSDFSVDQAAPVDLTQLPFAQYWWRLFQILGDLILVSVGYYIAYLLRFDGTLLAEQERNFVNTLPYVIIIKILVFSQFKLYGSHWRYVGVNDVLKVVQAVGLSTLVFAAGVSMTQPEFFSRSVILIDAVMAVLLIAGSRVLLRVLREFILNIRSGDGLVRTIIVGAGDAGELVLREARHNGKLALDVIGFLDDDPAKANARIHGVPVLGPISAVPEICRGHRAALAIVAIPSAPTSKVVEIGRLCRQAKVALKVLSFKLADYDARSGGADDY